MYSPFYLCLLSLDGRFDGPASSVSNIEDGPIPVNGTEKKRNIRLVFYSNMRQVLILAGILVEAGYLIFSALVHQADHLNT